MLDSDVSTVISVLATFISVMYAFHYTGKRREAKLQSAGKHILCPTEEAVTQALHELTDLAAEELLIPRKNLTRDAHFIDDLRVPPGDLALFLEDLGEHFNITPPETAETFGDLLALVVFSPTAQSPN